MTGTTEKPGSAFGLEAGEGEATWFVGQLATVKMGSDETQGRCAILEFVTPAGGGSPYHVHRNEDESFYVLEGEMTFYVGDAVIEAKEGWFVFGPRNVPHTFVVGPQARPATSCSRNRPASTNSSPRLANPPEARTLPPPPAGPPNSPRSPRSPRKRDRDPRPPWPPTSK